MLRLPVCKLTLKPHRFCRTMETDYSYSNSDDELRINRGVEETMILIMFAGLVIFLVLQVYR